MKHGRRENCKPEKHENVKTRNCETVKSEIVNIAKCSLTCKVCFLCIGKQEKRKPCILEAMPIMEK